MKHFALTCALALAAALPALAADSPWLGTWKLDPAKSHFTGETFTYTKAATGLMRYNDGSTVSYDFGIDGKEYPTVDGRTVSWTVAGDNAWDSKASYNGMVIVESHRSLSADGKTLTIVSNRHQPDGQTVKTESTWKRVTGTSGLLGEWKSTKITSAPDTYIVSAKGDGWHWEVPSYKETVEGKPDGTDLAISGPLVPAGITIAYKTTSPKSLSYVVKEKGKPISIGTETLAADGKSYTDTSWSPGKESEKTTGFYVKQ